MMKLKLIACDLDGTLLLNGAQSLQNDTCDLIRKLHEKGILFCAASGRQYTNLRRLFEPVKDGIAYLCENGSLSFYKGKRIHKVCMDREAGAELIRGILASPGAEVLLSGEMCCYVQPKDMAYYDHIQNVVKNDTVIVPDILAVKEEYLKISIYEKGGLHDEAYWQARYGDRFTVVTGGGEWLDIMPKDVNKATGLRHILDELDILPEECMAIGDNDNDREMLEMAGFPAAVRSAKPYIRKLARFETDTVEDLFRRILSGELRLGER